MDIINNFFADLSNFLWGNFGVANLVIGGGIFFLIYSRLTPFRYFKHAFEILLGKHDNPDDEGQISHFQALSTALSSTVGIGNIYVMLSDFLLILHIIIYYVIYVRP